MKDGVHIELPKLSSKKINSPNKKCAKDLKRHFAKRIWMTNKYILKMFSIISH